MFERLFALVVVMALLLHAQTTGVVEGQKASAIVVPRKVVLVVQNHAGGAEIPMMALTDALTAKLSGRGFQVINPYNVLGVNQNRSVIGETIPASSALELARGCRADGLVTASVLDFLDSPIGTPPVLHQFSVRISISLADAGSGAVVCGETVKMKSQKYTNNQVAQNRLEYLGDLLHAAAEECATKLEANQAVRAWNPTPLPPPPPLRRRRSLRHQPRASTARLILL